MDVIDILIKNIPLECPTNLLFSVFVYKMLTPKYNAKYGVVWTPILYAVGSIFVRTILALLRVGNENILGFEHSLMMWCFICIWTMVWFEGKKRDIFISIIIILIVQTVMEYIVGGGTYLWLKINVLSIRSIYTNITVYIAKITFLPVMYILIIIWDMWRQKNKEKLIRYVMIINFVIGLIQLSMLFGLIQTNRSIFEDNAYMMTVISNMFLLIGYFIVTEVFEEISKQQQREKEMEKIKAERQYQYNYYQLAQRQGEEIRDIRHDLRNQLQTIQYLLESEDEKETEIGKEVFENLKKRVNSIY